MAAVGFFFAEKWHSLPHANQKARHYGLRQVLNSCRPNVFVLNIQGKLLHQRPTMFSELSGSLKSPAAKHTFNCIIALKIVFVQSIVGINCGSMRLLLEKSFFCFFQKEKKSGPDRD